MNNTPSRHFWRFLCFFAIVCLAFALMPTSVLGQTSKDITLEIVPNLISLAVGETSTVLVALRNTSPNTLTHVKLASTAKPGLTVVPDNDNEREIAPGASSIWSLAITRISGEQAIGPVQLRFDFQHMQAGKTARDVTLGTIAVQDIVPESIDKIANVKIESAVEQLDQGNKARLYLLVTNITSVPITVTNVLTQTPSFINFEAWPRPFPAVRLEPQTRYILPIVISQTDRVERGKHLLLFDVRLEWFKDGRKAAGDLTAASAFSAGIIGETAILSAIGIPSLLLLPGFLMVGVFLAFWKYVKPKRGPALDAKNSDFWLIAITISLICAWIYPRVTQVDYLHGAYGLGDVALVWLSSLIIGIIAWLFVVVGFSAVWAWFYIPHAADSPITTLRKLQRNRVSYQPPIVEATVGEQKGAAFLLSEVDDRWVAPGIRMVWKEKATYDQRKEFKARLDAAEKKSQPASVAALLAEGVRDGIITLGWQSHTKFIKGPMKATNVSPNTDVEIRFIQEAEEEEKR